MIRFSAIENMYGVSDLAKKQAFAGGYINFGYWKDIDYTEIRKSDIEKRIFASKELYKLVIDSASVKKSDTVVEFGCGHGYGLSQVVHQYMPNKAIGIDVMNQQIERAKIKQKNTLLEYPSLFFKVGSALDSGLDNDSVDIVISLEAAQSFHPVSLFGRECYRILRDNGEVNLCFHTATCHKGYNELGLVFKGLGVDDYVPITEYCNDFCKEGFACINVLSIGEYVFPGFETWRNLFEEPNSWAQNYFLQYKKCNLGYFLLKFKKV